jgi:hypothetical protein
VKSRLSELMRVWSDSANSSLRRTASRAAVIRPRHQASFFSSLGLLSSSAFASAGLSPVAAATGSSGMVVSVPAPEEGAGFRAEGGKSLLV